MRQHDFQRRIKRQAAQRELEQNSIGKVLKRRIGGWW
jgi:hypothetical protein